MQHTEAGQMSRALLSQKPGHEGANLPQAAGILRDLPGLTSNITFSDGASQSVWPNPFSLNLLITSTQHMISLEIAPGRAWKRLGISFLMGTGSGDTTPVETGDHEAEPTWDPILGVPSLAAAWVLACRMLSQ